MNEGMSSWGCEVGGGALSCPSVGETPLDGVCMRLGEIGDEQGGARGARLGCESGCEGVHSPPPSPDSGLVILAVMRQEMGLECLISASDVEMSIQTRRRSDQAEKLFLRPVGEVGILFREVRRESNHGAGRSGMAVRLRPLGRGALISGRSKRTLGLLRLLGRTHLRYLASNLRNLQRLQSCRGRRGQRQSGL